MRLLEYRLRAETLCLGHRMKGGLFRPCDTQVVRYSAATGSLRAYLGADVHAAGYLIQDPPPTVHYLVYAPRDRALGTSKIPVTVQYLANVEGRIFASAGRHELPERIDFAMGALKSHGFGKCHIELLGEADTRPARGWFMTRVPESAASCFGITILQPRFGYLFQVTSPVGGVYVRSIYEGSLVEGPTCLVREAWRA